MWHADAGDDARGADRARADADLDGVGAGVDQRARGVIGRDIAGDDLDMVEFLAQTGNRLRDQGRVAVGGVDDDDVGAGFDQGDGALIAGIADGRGAADQQASGGVLGGVGIGLGLFDVLDGDQTGGAIGVVDNDDAFDAMHGHQLARFGRVDAFADGDQALAGHQLGGGFGTVAFKADVAIGEDADQLVCLGFDHRETGDRTMRDDGADFVELGIGIDGDRVDDHAGFETLDGADLVGLLLVGQVAVDDAHAAGLGHGDRQAGLGNRVHGRGDQGDVQIYAAGELRARVNLGRHDVRRAGFRAKRRRR